MSKGVRIILILTLIIVVVATWCTKTFNEKVMEKNKQSLRIITANIEYRNKNKNFSDEVLKYSPDVLILLEWTGDNFNEKEFIKNGYEIIVDAPQQSTIINPKQGAHGVGLFVKKNIALNGERIVSPINGPYKMPYGVARLNVNDKNITIIAIHAPPPISRWTTKPTIDYVLSKIDRGKLKFDWSVGKQGDDVILAGDFNIISLDPYLRKMKGFGLYDTYSRVNFMPGPTWAYKPWLPKLFRLDYIFSTIDSKTENSHILKIEGSDHNAVISDIRI